MTNRPDVLVIGGGVIGLSCAYALLEAGRSVRVLERDRVGSGASHGNAGLVTPSHGLPLTRPGTVRKVLRWMLHPDSPFYVRPRLDLRFLAWALRFARNCNRESMLKATRGRVGLLESSRDLWVEWIEKEGLDCEWEERGLLHVFATEEARVAAEPERKLLTEHGIAVDVFDRDGLLTLEPAVRDEMQGALRYPRDAQLRPDRLVAELARVVRAKGAQIEEQCDVRGLDENTVLTHGGPRQAKCVVLAAGAWSPALRPARGRKIPVQPGKGYSITAARPDPCPRHPLLLHEANMVVTPFPDGYRLGGTMELSGYDTRLNRTRLDALRKGCARFLRHPPLEDGVEWYGFRPMTPDELPIIDRIGDVVVATGHGMMGVSMAPATARLVAALATGEEPSLDPTPYSLARFS